MECAPEEIIHLEMGTISVADASFGDGRATKKTGVKAAAATEQVEEGKGEKPNGTNQKEEDETKKKEGEEAKSNNSSSCASTELRGVSPQKKSWYRKRGKGFDKKISSVLLSTKILCTPLFWIKSKGAPLSLFFIEPNFRLVGLKYRVEKKKKERRLRGRERTR